MQQIQGSHTDPHQIDSPIDRYCAVRSFTEQLAAPLSPEDQIVQSMPDSSPTNWHRAHTTWFYETLVLDRFVAGHVPVDERYGFLFNSYYESVGPRQGRPDRGMITRPDVNEVGDYRRQVDRAMIDLLGESTDHDVAAMTQLGLHHEQQHQELLLMDIKHVLSRNPFHPAYGSFDAISSAATVGPPGFVDFDGGIVAVGHEGPGFSFDNESPRHDQIVRPFGLADRLVTAADWMEFQADGGYERPTLWLSDGWAMVKSEGWDAPMYWHRVGGEWHVFTLGGSRPIDLAEPVCHVSLYEADAFARWWGGRLPTEAEWELASQSVPFNAQTFNAARLHPDAADPADGTLRQMWGDTWEWTQSPYSAYPGFTPVTGAVGEYNGKFMVNQAVLRGGCCVTPNGHVRPTYRNFYPPAARWPFTGVRVAVDR